MEKELLLELIYKHRPNDEVLNKSIDELVKKSNKELTKEEIETRLKNNGFNGMYLISSKLYDRYAPKGSAGFYDKNKKVVCIDINKYYKNTNTAIHELVHSIIDGKFQKDIEVDENLSRNYLTYGYGIEEGIATICEGVQNLQEIDDYQVNHYSKQTNMSKQINKLYEFYSEKKYSNILIHALKEPEDIIPLIPRMYEEILNKNIEKVSANIDLSRRNAFDVVKGTDVITEEKEDCELYYSSELTNAIYLTIADKNLRDGNKNTISNYQKLFTYDFLPKIIKSNEYKLLMTIFGEDDHDYDEEFLCDQAKKLNKISNMNIINQDQVEKDKILIKI